MNTQAGPLGVKIWIDSQTHQHAPLSFHANGLVILERNYLEVYPYENWSGKVIAHYEQGQTFRPTSLEMISGETSPPPYLTEADLIALMDKHGIGTDATHAEHIEKVKQRHYAGLENNHFLPGKIGLGLVEGYDTMGFQMSKPNLRAQLEADLKEICEGSKDPQEVLRRQIEQYRSVFEAAMPQVLKIDVAMAKYLEEAPQPVPEDVIIPNVPQLSSVCKCPACGCDMVLKERKTGEFFISCLGYPHCRVAVWLPGDVKGVTVLQDTCTQCQGSPKKLEFKLRPNTYVWSLRSPFVTCIGGCDEEVYDLLQFRSLKNVPSTADGHDRPGILGRSRIGNMGSNRAPGSGGGSRPGPDGGGGRPGPSRGGGTSGSGKSGGTSRPGRGGGSSGSGRGGSALLFGRGGTSSGPQRGGGSSSFGRGRGTSSGRGGSRTSGSVNNNSYSIGTQSSSSSQQSSGRGAVANENVSNISRQSYASGVSRGSGQLRQDSGLGSSWNPSGSSTYQDQENKITCSCNREAALLTVKNGPNTGRPFYRCANFQNGCNLFLWADDGNVSSRERERDGHTGTRWSQTVHNTREPPQNGGDETEVLCQCGHPAKRLTVVKDTPNKGRLFYVCSKDRSQECRFFQWADEVPPNDGTRGGRGNWDNEWESSSNWSEGRKGVKRGATQRQQSSSKRKCGLCGGVGHDRRNCPQKEN